MANQFVNIKCRRCGSPLLDFTILPKGQIQIQSHGVEVDFNKPGPALAICPKDGQEEPFDRKLMGQ